MFPLEFPLRVLQHRARKRDVVLDPFAGRGTTLYAGRLQGLEAFGIDSNPVAVAISRAKLSNTTPGRIVASARQILKESPEPKDPPKGEFWKLAFESKVLRDLCKMREALIDNCSSDTRIALRAIILGSLHGPRGKQIQSYFSNQCPRTFAPKPAYATKYWQQHNLKPPSLAVFDLIERRALHCFGYEETRGRGAVMLGDSQNQGSFAGVTKRATWIVTSPPYYGMRTYLQDQWLRLWFLGGPDVIDYRTQGQLSHSGAADFAEGLRSVWTNCAKHAQPNCRLIIRFGAINDRKLDPVDLIKQSLDKTPWKIETARHAGTASGGKRQARQFVVSKSPIEEYDVWARLR